MNYFLMLTRAVIAIYERYDVSTATYFKLKIVLELFINFDGLHNIHVHAWNTIDCFDSSPLVQDSNENQLVIIYVWRQSSFVREDEEEFFYGFK